MRLTPIQQLDKVLEWFAMDISEMKDGEKIYIRQRANRKQIIPLIIETFPDLNDEQFIIDSDLILEKLAKDCYLYKHQTTFEYNITFEGKVFSRQGGYSKSENRKTKAANNQSLIQWLIAGGTALAGIYGLYELIKNICH